MNTTAPAHVPTHRRSLSGKFVPLERPVMPWLNPDRVVPASRHAARQAFGRLTPEQRLDHLAGTLDPDVLHELALDEMTRHPVNTRAVKRAMAKAMAHKARRGRRAAARSTIAARLANPAPSRGFLRLLLSTANRQAEQAARAESMVRHPAGSAVAA